MSRIEKRFSDLKAADRTALVPFITAGDPNPEITVPTMHALVTGGADLIELGVPFSDPMADGSTRSDSHLATTTMHSRSSHTSSGSSSAHVRRFRPAPSAISRSTSHSNPPSATR